MTQELHNLHLITSSYYWQTSIAYVSPSVSEAEVLSSEGITSGVPFPVTQAKGKEHISKPQLTHLLAGFVQDVTPFYVVIGNE
jgi:hypothetical protein